ncbi:putative NIT2-nitrilase [Syncephalis fuscata]|nr:putative NIT2-nitrilase [Syncephalis fuscata]
MLAAVGQFCATAMWRQNLEACRTLIANAAQQGAKILFLPEASDFITNNSRESVELTYNGVPSQYLSEIKQMAKQHHIWVSVGLHESTVSSVSELIFNTHWMIDDKGNVQGKYRKLHLFDVNVANGPRLFESASTLRGEKIESPVASPIGRIGLAVCYDLRFPELAAHLREQGAQILTYPSAFTQLTGQAHWEVLLRARAIETQTFVVASAQCGQHNEKRTSYGHAMMVDPWGKVIACCKDTDEPTLALADIDLDYLERIRREMPLMDHRRRDLFL